MSEWVLPMGKVFVGWLDSVLAGPVKLDDDFLIGVFARERAGDPMAMKTIRVVYGTDEVEVLRGRLETNARGLLFGGANGTYGLGFDKRAGDTDYTKSLVWHTVDNRVPWVPKLPPSPSVDLADLAEAARKAARAEVRAVLAELLAGVTV